MEIIIISRVIRRAAQQQVLSQMVQMTKKTKKPMKKC